MKLSKKHHLWALPLLLTLLPGCYTRPAGGPSAPPVEFLPAATPSAHRAAPPAVYQLGFGDEIEIKFFRNPEFNETVTVRPDGRISLQKVGEIDVAGKTPAQLDSLITAVYEQFVVDPEVTVIVRNIGSHKFYILGEVETPGGYPLEREMSVLQALATAGGPKHSARISNVILLRQNAHGQIQPILIDVKKLVRSTPDPREMERHHLTLQPRDIVYVPKTTIASISDFMQQVYDGLLPPVDLYLRAVLFYDR